MNLHKPVSYFMMLLGFVFALIGSGHLNSKVHTLQDLRNLDAIPLGSRLEALALIDRQGDIYFSTVTQWKPIQKAESVRSGETFLKNEYGAFTQKDLDQYYTWMISNDRTENFTGEISFILYRFFGSAPRFWFQFIQGKLVKKGWEYLPR